MKYRILEYKTLSENKSKKEAFCPQYKHSWWPIWCSFETTEEIEIFYTLSDAEEFIYKKAAEKLKNSANREILKTTKIHDVVPQWYNIEKYIP